MRYKIGDNVEGFKIIKEMTGGGMSRVYVSENYLNNTLTGNAFAIIKVISKEMIAKDNSTPKAIEDQWSKALDEFTLTWAIFEKPHPNIAKPIKWNMSDDKKTVYIITEFVDGPSLTKLISDQKALTVDRALYYFKKICLGVSHLHHLNGKKTIIHRDLKSDNIMLTRDLREVKIIDYGIATSFYDNAFESSEGTIYCTANYTTVDILKLTSSILNGANNGDPKDIKKLVEIITPQFDFHALGIILYEMLTGSFPFSEVKDEKDREKIKKWLKYDLPIISNIINNVPTSIDNIIFRLTASKEEDKKFRYKIIDELIEDLKTWDAEDRRNEPLLKPMEKRIFQQPHVFDVEALKNEEKFYHKWWFFIIVNVVAIAIILVVIISILVIK